ncbi:hypothetical protein BJ165DRAFT_1503610, partial [Panaeolus papilionaceus]
KWTQSLLSAISTTTWSPNLIMGHTIKAPISSSPRFIMPSPSSPRRFTFSARPLRPPILPPLPIPTLLPLPLPILPLMLMSQFQPSLRLTGSRTKTPKYVPEGADDSDVDINIPKTVSTISVTPKDPQVTITQDNDVVMSDASGATESTTPSNDSAPTASASSSGSKGHRSSSNPGSVVLSGSSRSSLVSLVFIST